jgi:hypothetical protein
MYGLATCVPQNAIDRESVTSVRTRFRDSVVGAASLQHTSKDTGVVA